MGWPPGTQRGRRGFRHHRRCRRPRRIDSLAGYLGHACPAILLPRYGDRVADRLAGLRYEIEPAITEADDDLAGCEFRAEAHDLAAAAAHFRAAAPIPKE